MSTVNIRSKYDIKQEGNFTYVIGIGLSHMDDSEVETRIWKNGGKSISGNYANIVRTSNRSIEILKHPMSCNHVRPTDYYG